MKPSYLLGILGVVLIAFGLIGFINQPLFGVFAIDAWRNIINLLAGAGALIAMDLGEVASTKFSKFLGYFFGVIAVLGFIVGSGQILGFLQTNTPDNFLTLAFAVIFLANGYSSAFQTEPRELEAIRFRPQH